MHTYIHMNVTSFHFLTNKKLRLTWTIRLKLDFNGKNLRWYTTLLTVIYKHYTMRTYTSLCKYKRLATKITVLFHTKRSAMKLTTAINQIVLTQESTNKHKILYHTSSHNLLSKPSQKYATNFLCIFKIKITESPSSLVSEGTSASTSAVSSALFATLLALHTPPSSVLSASFCLGWNCERKKIKKLLNSTI